MIPIRFTADPLPADFSGTLQDFQTRFLSNLTGEIQDDHVLIGQVGGAEPTTNVGPWLNVDTWYVWDGSKYVPAPLRVGNADFTISIQGDITKNIIQTLQDKDGVIALTSDVYEGRDTVVLSGTTPTIDWGASNNFSQLLTGNTTYKLSNINDGQEIVIAVSNGVTAYTVSWPSSVFWTGGTPVQSGINTTDLYLLKSIGGSVFGRQLAGYV
jgi:hypothetical protein